MNLKLIFIISFIIRLFSGPCTEAQEIDSVSGIITAFRKIPLNNVKVVSEKSGEIAYTNSAGIFFIKSFNKDILTFSASGFVTRKLKVRIGNFYKIGLDYVDNLSSFNEAVTHGHISEELLRESINSDAESHRDYTKYKTIYELITGEFYNVRVNGTSVVNVKIRSLDRSPQVLYVVDDRIVPEISFVVPSDVKKIEFIDDVGATIYGSKGANGVIKITLK